MIRPFPFGLYGLACAKCKKSARGSGSGRSEGVVFFLSCFVYQITARQAGRHECTGARCLQSSIRSRRGRNEIKGSRQIVEAGWKQRSEQERCEAASNCLFIAAIKVVRFRINKCLLSITSEKCARPGTFGWI